MRKDILLIALVVFGSLALIGGLAYLGARPAKPLEDVTTACVSHTQVGWHVHARLRIVIDGKEEKIPENVGVTSGCMRPIHTHDETGTIHLEMPTQQDVFLHQFFKVWEQPFSSSKVMQRAIGPDDVLRVTVNDKEVADLERILLHDDDNIVVEVSKKEGEKS